MKRRIILWSLVVFCGILSIGVLNPVYARENVELSFWHALSGPRSEAVNKLIDNFNQKNPGITIRAKQIKSPNPTMGNSYHELYKTILESIARQTPPDIAQVYENWTVQLIDIQAIVPLEEHVGKEIPADSVRDLVPVFRESNTFDGKLWTLPFNKSVYVLYYNKDLFKKAGVNPPATWEEFRSVSAKISSHNAGSVYGIAFRPSVDIFGHYQYSHGSDFIQGDRAIFNNPTGLDNIRFWVDMVHKDKSAVASFTDEKEFIAGRSAMFIESSSRLSRFREVLGFDWGAVVLPRGSTQRYQMAGTNVAVFNHLTPEKRAAAAKFAAYLIDSGITTDFAMETGYLPVRNSGIASTKYQDLLKRDERYRAGVETLQYAVAQPKCAAWEMIRGIVDDAMFEALSLRNTPENVLERAVDTANILIRNLTGMVVR